MWNASGLMRREFLASVGGFAIAGGLFAADRSNRQQRLAYAPRAGRPYRLLNVASAKAMDVLNASTDSGGRVIQFHWKGIQITDVNQHWYFVRLRRRNCYVIVPGTNPTLALTASDRVDTAELQQATYQRRKTQIWQLREVVTPIERSYVLMQPTSRLVASVPAASLKDFAPVSTAPLECAHPDNTPLAHQRWFISELASVPGASDLSFKSIKHPRRNPRRRRGKHVGARHPLESITRSGSR